MISIEGTSQGSFGGVSACAVMSCEAVLRMLYTSLPERLHDVIGIGMLRAIKDTVAASAIRRIEHHLDTNDVLSLVERYSLTLNVIEEKQIVDADLSTFCQTLLQRRSLEPVAAILTRPPETIAVIVRPEGGFIVFDSHSRNDHIGSSAFIFLRTVDELNECIRTIWPRMTDDLVAGLDDASALVMQSISTTFVKLRAKRALNQRLQPPVLQLDALMNEQVTAIARAEAAAKIAAADAATSAKRKQPPNSRSRVEWNNPWHGRTLTRQEMQERSDHAMAQRLGELEQLTAGDRAAAAAEQQATFECVFCSQTVLQDHAFVVNACKHVMCLQCANLMCTTTLRELRYPVRCAMCPIAKGVAANEVPVNGARGTLSYDEVKLVLVSDDEMELLCRASMRAATSGAAYATCPACEWTVERADDNPHLVCMQCTRESCMDCQTPRWHAGMTCQQFRAWRVENDSGDAEMDKMYKNGQFRFCPSPTCRARVELDQGCHKMICLCGVYFCYICEKLLDRKAPYAHFNEPGATCALFEVPPEDE